MAVQKNQPRLAGLIHLLTKHTCFIQLNNRAGLKFYFTISIFDSSRILAALL
jgi:hypothetical protein